MRYRVNHPQVINEMIDGEAIMINLVSGSYYSLDSVGGEVWGLLEESLSVDDIVTQLSSRYDASDDIIRSAVENLLEQLSREQLVMPDHGSAASSLPSGSRPSQLLPFRAPRLQKFTDMQDLILLDPVHEVDSRGWPHASADAYKN
jgi:Coenzyme PQQ synthesis protein D (PqqD)